MRLDYCNWTRNRKVAQSISLADQLENSCVSHSHRHCYFKAHGVHKEINESTHESARIEARTACDFA